MIVSVKRSVGSRFMKHQLLATCLIAGLGAACSSDVARFDADPFANPFGGSRAAYDPVVTNSTNRRPQGQAQPVAPVTQPTTQALPPPNQPMIRQGAVQGTNPNATAPVTTGSVASANYPKLADAPAPRPPATVLGGANPATSGLGSGANGWTAAGGTPVTLRQGESLATLSSRYGVPISAIMAVNGFSNVHQAKPGQQVIIPAYNPVTGGKVMPQRVATIERPKPATPAKAAQPRVPEAKRSEARQPMPPRLAQASKVEAPKVPARQVMTRPVSEAEKRAAAKLRDEKTAPAPTTRRIEIRQPPKSEDVETTSSIPETKLPPKVAPMVAKAEPAEETPNASGEPQFRWPAKGRVISGFGARGTGGANDGINIALPEGTPVRAAEGGTVVHADDALKGYGKLVLIRHPNGYVSVYAHNGELNVKRGEAVRRGQVIAKSGQTGNVTAPQLHFEIRKGATPVDPSKYLGG